MNLRALGKYRILGKLGQGAMGEVYRAEDPVLERQVAIKVISGRLSGDEAARHRFLREAKAAAQLNHPNIVTVHDFGEEGGMAYMAMELLEGQDLRAMLAGEKVGLLADRLSLMEQTLDGLAYAHSRGVFHRDLKPGNVHVLPSGQVKVMDFGLAQREQDDAGTATIMGTPYYMAPEQVRGERAQAPADVFSLGALFYELLSGRRPFTGPSIAAVLFALAHKEPEPLEAVAPEVPAGFAAVVMRALAKQPEARFADAGEMLQAFRLAWAGGEVPASGPVPAADAAPARALGPRLSARDGISPELREALDEVEQYLDDRVPPLMVADSVDVLTGAPADGAAAEIAAWAERQRIARPDLPLADLVFHALHKLAVIGEFQLVEGPKLLGFLRETGDALVAALPPGADRDRLRRALAHLGESEMVRTGSVDVLWRAAEAADLLPPPSAAALPGLRRLSLLEQRLQRESVGSAALAARRRVASQAITVAATAARSEVELQGHLRRLRAVGVESGAQQVFRSLGEELADWAMPKGLVPDTAEIAPADEVRAMRQIVSLPEDPIEVARRYRHLVSAAVEQFNGGNLGRAVQMIELATRLAAEKKVEAGFLEPILRKGHEELDHSKLRLYMDRPERHEQLRAVMAFFEPGLGAATLLDQVEGEERRDRRRLLLDLLLVHGEPARALARERLLASLEAPADDYARRNWIYLLRLVPRPADEAVEAEIAAVARFATPGNPSFLVKEALSLLGQTKHSRAAQALVGLLRAWEGAAAGGPEGEAREEALAALDRAAAALARQGRPEAWHALLEHGLSGRPELGKAAARLAELGAQDLSSSPDVVEALVEEVRREMPRGVLGRLVGRESQDLPSLVAALAGTATPEVRSVLEEVRKRFAGKEPARAAARALEPRPAPTGTAPGHAGDLDAYGLPAVLQRLAEQRATGTLSLLPPEGGGAPAALGLAQGRVTSARWAHREGPSALFQLFERPFAGKYAFEAGPPPPGSGDDWPDLATLVREGVSRARALARTSAVVPEDLALEATGAPPGTVADEGDYDLVVSLWEKACAGLPARQIEAELAADAFRILRPLAQWLEEEALRVSAPPAEATETAAGA